MQILPVTDILQITDTPADGNRKRKPSNKTLPKNQKKRKTPLIKVPPTKKNTRSVAGPSTTTNSSSVNDVMDTMDTF
jgi:hypothetical protein